ncbi:MAG: hypothetical protein WCS96_02360 [Victivallales bacterium]
MQSRKGCFYTVAKRDDKKQVQMTLWTDPNGQRQRIAADSRVILNPVESGDGIIEVPEAKNFLYLNEAPSEGYRQLEIAYDPAKDDFKSRGGHLENARYFYFKVGGFYGKGRIHFYEYGENVSMQLFCQDKINSDNPRNLKSSRK